MQMQTINPDAIEAAQRKAIAGTLAGSHLRELARMKLAPTDVVQRLENRLRVLKNIHVRRAKRSKAARKRLPELKAKLAAARDDLTYPRADLKLLEHRAAKAARAAKYSPEVSERTEKEIESIESWLAGIDEGDADALVEATAHLREREA